MNRLVEFVVAVSAIGGILTFLGVRGAIRRTLRTLGRPADDRRSESTDVEKETR